jgi:ubiquitin-conjugating enzyme E2 D/E
MSTLKRIRKDYQELNKLIKEDSSNAICSLSQLKDGDLYQLTGVLYGPSGTPYAGGIFPLEVEFPSDYPFKPPKIKFTTKIFHPNISDDGKICISSLKDDWSPALSLVKVMQQLSSLFSDPNPDDPLAPEVAAIMKENHAEYVRIAREYTQKYA